MSNRPPRDPHDTIRGVRAPVLQAAPQARAWGTGAGDEIRVVDGSLVVVREGHSRGLVRASDITRIRLSAGSVVFETTEQPVVLPISAWDPGAATASLVLSAADRLERNGFRALITALGRNDAWTFDVDATTTVPSHGRLVLPSGQTVLEGLTRRCQAFGALTVAITIAVAGLSFAHHHHGSVLGALAGALLLAGAATLLQANSAWSYARKRIATPVEALHRVEGLPSPVQLATTADTIVVVSPYGDEAHLPGPQLGGVVHAVALVQAEHGVREVRLHIATQAGDISPMPAMTILAGWWHDAVPVGDAVLAWLEASGITVERMTVPRNAPVAKDKVWPDVRKFNALWPNEPVRLLTLVIAVSTGAAFVVALAVGPALAALPLGVALLMMGERVRWARQCRRGRSA